MTRNDTAVVGVLILLLAIIAGMVGIPALQATTASASPTATPTDTVEASPYREGVLGHVGSISPLTARTQVDRDLVALVFSGLVRNGPDGALVPDLASHWTVDASGRLPAKVSFTVGGYENPDGYRRRLEQLAPDHRARMEADPGDWAEDYVGDTERMVTMLRGRAYPSLEIDHQVLPGEYHETAVPMNLSRSLRYLFGSPR